MTILGLDIQHIVELGVQIAQAGAIRAGEVQGDDLFEYTVGIAAVVYAMNPDG